MDLCRAIHACYYDVYDYSDSLSSEVIAPNSHHQQEFAHRKNLKSGIRMWQQFLVAVITLISSQETCAKTKCIADENQDSYP